MNKTRRDPMAYQLCGWGNCATPTEGMPLCERHLFKAWAYIQVRLTEEQRHALEQAAREELT